MPPAKHVNGEDGRDPFDEELKADYRKWAAELARLEKKIDMRVRCSRLYTHNLGVLVKAGADRKLVVKLLALAVIGPSPENDFAPESRGDWTKGMREKKEALKSLAKRMETLARDAEKRAEDPLTRVQAWEFFIGGGALQKMKFPEPLASETGISFIISGMRALARHFRKEAENFGRYMRGFSQRDMGVVLFLVGLYRGIGKEGKLKHFKEAAELLMMAFAVSGKARSRTYKLKAWRKSEDFSASELEKTFKRHARPLILSSRPIRFIDRVLMHKLSA